MNGFKNVIHLLNGVLDVERNKFAILGNMD